MGQMSACIRADELQLQGRVMTKPPWASADAGGQSASETKEDRNG